MEQSGLVEDVLSTAGGWNRMIFKLQPISRLRRSDSCLVALQPPVISFQAKGWDRQWEEDFKAHLATC